MSRPVPKFLSFKPKPKPEQTPVAEPKPDHSHRRHRRRSHEGDDEDRHSRPSRSKHGHRQHGERRSRESPMDDATALPSLDYLYTPDTRGDSCNLTYGSLDKHDVPEYYRTGHGRVIGLSRYLRIDRAESNHFRIVLDDQRLSNEHEPRPLLEARRLPKERRSLPRRTADREAQPSGQDFIRLEGSRKRKRSNATKEEFQHQFRGETNWSEVDSHSDSSEPENEALAVQQSIGKLVRSLQEDPTDYEAWKSLIERQIDLIVPGAEEASLTTTQRSSLAKLRLDLYEKAVSAVLPQNKERLVSAMLREGALVWTASSYMNKTEEAVRQNPTSIVLWRRLVDRLQAFDSTGLTWDEQRQRLLRCLKDLRDVRKLTRDDQNDNDLGTIQIYLVLRLLKSTSDAGYKEQAIATWQALMALHANARRPTSTFQERLAALEAQMSSDQGRFGQDRPMSGGDCSEVFKKTADLVHGPPYRRFAQHETDLDHRNEMPFCEDAYDADIAEDPFLVVFFRDIVDVLETTDLGVNLNALIDAFLHFFGLPSVPSGISPWLWRIDGFLFGDAKVSHEEFSTPKSPACAEFRAIVTMDTLWFGDAFPPLLKWSPRIVGFIDQGLETLSDACNDDVHIMCYRIAFQAAYLPTSAPKIAKRLLRAHPSHLLLYDAAARAEIALGNYEKAHHIWSAASRMPAPLDVSEDRVRTHKASVTDLSISSAWAELELGKAEMSLRLLYSMHHNGLVDSPSAAVKLSLVQDLHQGYWAALHHKDIVAAASYASALSLLKYLESHDGLSAALAFLDSLITDPTTAPERKPLPTFTEIIHQLQARLIAHHLRHNKPHRPAYLLSVINHALAHSPGNTILLSVYDTLTAHVSLLTPLLSSTPPEHVAPRPSSPSTTWLHAIRRAAKGPSPESARSLFRGALLDDSSETRLCPALWNEWLDFERGILSRSAAERGSKETGRQWRRTWDVWIAGRQALPWNKYWVLSGFMIFDGAPREAEISSDALRAAYEDMLDRSLRIRKEIDWGDEGDVR